MGRHIRRVWTIIVLLALLLAISGCGKTASTSSAQWKFDRVIAKPLSKIGGASAVKLGDIDHDSVSVMIPAKSLAKDTKISLVTPKSVPGYPAAEMTPLGAPIDISGKGVRRLDGKVTVTMKFDPKSLGKTADASYIRFVYHNGREWDYIKPESVNTKTGSAAFGMYHFSLVGLAKIKDETKLTEEWIHSQALDKTLRDNINKESDYVAKQIIEQTLEKMGVKDKSVTQKVASDMLVSDGDKIREMYESAKKGEKETAFQKMVVFLGTGISRTLPEGALRDAINGIDENVDDIAAVPKALAYALEGQHKEAAKIIGEAIADKFLITTAGKIAVEVAEHQINSWKNSEVQAAYEAYKNGSDAKFWGYNNDAGDFETVWNQMRGISRQLELETVDKERKIREESGMPPLTPEREAIIREGVKQSYRRQFKERLGQEQVIKKEEDKLNTLFGAFEDANLLDRALGPAGLDRGFTFEQKLDLLHNFAEKMMRDTGRPDFKDVKGLRPEKALRLDDLITGAKIYFGKDGKQKYLDYLSEEFDTVDAAAAVPGAFKAFYWTERRNDGKFRADGSSAWDYLNEAGDGLLYNPKPGDRVNVSFRSGWRLTFWNVGETGGSEKAKAKIESIQEHSTPGDVITKVYPPPTKYSIELYSKYDTVPASGIIDTYFDPKAVYELVFTGGPGGVFRQKAGSKRPTNGIALKGKVEKNPDGTRYIQITGGFTIKMDIPDRKAFEGFSGEF